MRTNRQKPMFRVPKVERNTRVPKEPSPPLKPPVPSSGKHKKQTAS